MCCVDEKSVACVTRSRTNPTQAARLRSCLLALTTQCVCVGGDSGGKDNDGDRVGANQNNVSFRRILISVLTNVFVRSSYTQTESVGVFHALGVAAAVTA